MIQNPTTLDQFDLAQNTTTIIQFDAGQNPTQNPGTWADIIEFDVQFDQNPHDYDTIGCGIKILDLIIVVILMRVKILL